MPRRCLMMIGSDQRCEWRIEHADIAPKHLCIREDHGRFQATALDKDTYLDQFSMTVGKTYLLNVGQVITFGTIRIQFSVRAEVAPVNRPAIPQRLLVNPIRSMGQLQKTASASQWPLEKWQIALFCLCLLLPLTSLLMFTHSGPSQSQLKSALPMNLPTPSHKTASLAAEIPDRSNSQKSQVTEMSAAESEQHQAPLNDLATLITPQNIGNLSKLKPYGLASPLQRTGHYAATISAAARRYELDPALLKAIIHAESGFDPFAVSTAGAQGLMQIMPATAKDLALADPFHPGNNVLSGSKLLRRLLDRYQQDETLALAAYNAGEQAVEKYQGVPPFAETQNYIQKVRKLRIQYRLEKVKQMAIANVN